MKHLQEVPSFLRRPILGLAHWVNYKAEYYDGHTLPEGALVSEFVQLLAAHTSDGIKVTCESWYKDYISGAIKGDERRIDVLVGQEHASKSNNSNRLIFKKNDSLIGIEVKRASQYHNSACEADFKKLIALKQSCPKARFFQLLVYLRSFPKDLLTDRHYLKNNKNVFVHDGYKLVARQCGRSYGTASLSKKATFIILAEVLKR